MQERRGWIVAIACGLAVAAVAHSHAEAAVITRIGTLGGSQSVALDINDARQVVGQANVDGDAVAHAYLWHNGTITDLGALAGDANSAAEGINNLGEVVGWSEVGSGSFLKNAMLWHGGQTTNINTALGGTSTLAWDINDHGTVVGQGNITAGFAKGWIWNRNTGGGSAGTLPGYMGGANRAISNNDVVVGHSYFFGDPDHAHRAVPDGKSGWISEEIGPAGYGLSVATDVNDAGTMVGYAQVEDSAPWSAVIFTGDAKNPVIDLGRLEGFAETEANAINASGIIVGMAYPIDPFEDVAHAWVYMNGQMHDLNDLVDLGNEWQVLLNATGINAAGDIVGTGITADGLLAGFVVSGVVPSPGTIALVLAGAGLVAARRRR
ncbi:MAG: hypothetical protein AMXMBFR58_01430 [Phycisphaerae bacterium]